MLTEMSKAADTLKKINDKRLEVVRKMIIYGDLKPQILRNLFDKLINLSSHGWLPSWMIIGSDASLGAKYVLALVHVLTTG